MKSLSHVWLSVTPWTVAHQAPPSVEFSRQEYWSGLPFPSPEDLPNPGIEPRSLALQADALPSEPPGKPLNGCRILLKVDFKPEWLLLFQVDDRWRIVGGWMEQQTKGGGGRRSEKTHNHRQKHHLRVWSKTCTEKKLVWFWVWPAAGGSPYLFQLAKECAFSIYLYQCQTSQEPGENWAAYLNNSDNMPDRLCTVAPHLNVNWVGQWHCCSLSMFWRHGAGRHSLCPNW